MFTCFDGNTMFEHFLHCWGVFALLLALFHVFWQLGHKYSPKHRFLPWYGVWGTWERVDAGLLRDLPFSSVWVDMLNWAFEKTEKFIVRFWSDLSWFEYLSWIFSLKWWLKIVYFFSLYIILRELVSIR